MKFKTNFDWEGEITPFERQIIAKPSYLFLFAFLLQILYVFLTTLSTRGFDYNAINLYFPPAVAAAGEIVMSGISEFNGKTEASGWSNIHTSALITTLLFYFMVPSILLLTYLRWKAIPFEERMKKRIRKVYPVLILFGAIMINQYFLNWSTFAGQISTRNDIENSQKVYSAADVATGNVSAVYADAMEFLYVPAEKGGGGGKWKNIRNADGTMRDYKLPDVSALSSMSVKRISRFISAGEAETNIVMKLENDTTLAVSAVSNTSGGNSGFLNADGRKGKVQVSMVIYPSSYRINTDNR